jgi:hypothetical protein
MAANDSEQQGGRAAGETSDGFSTSGRNLITVTFDPTFDDLDAIYLKAAGSVISHVLIEHNGNFRSAATQMGANHSTLSRIRKKFNQNYNKNRFLRAGVRRAANVQLQPPPKIHRREGLFDNLERAKGELVSKWEKL